MLALVVDDNARELGKGLVGGALGELGNLESTNSGLDSNSLAVLLVALFGPAETPATPGWALSSSLSVGQASRKRSLFSSEMAGVMRTISLPESVSKGLSAWTSTSFLPSCATKRDLDLSAFLLM